MSDAGDLQPERQPAPVQPRIGDAERDRAVNALGVHLADGRLDREEFDERLGRALVARTAGDLQPLFADLPEPRPTGRASTAAAKPALPSNQGVRRTPLAATLVLTLVWPVAVLVCFATGWENWWWLIVAAMISAVVKQTYPGADPHAARRHRRPDDRH